MNKKVLVIDDDPAIIDVVSAALEFKEYDVTTLSEAEHAYDTALEVNPDLIILDYVLAGTNGKTIALDLREHPELQHTPIIMLSADPKLGDIAVEAGVNDFLPKPFALEELWDMVEKHM